MSVYFSVMDNGLPLIDQDPERVSAWLFNSPSDADLARLCAEVSNLVNLLVCKEDTAEEEISKWELVEEQVLNQIAQRWMQSYGLVRDAGWWVDAPASGDSDSGECA